MSYHSRQPSVASSIVSNPTAHPQFIGPWRLGKTLGRGATGRVLLATHRTNNQKAAVKVVSKSELDEEEIKKSNNPNGLPYGIEREIIIMKLLTHPNVLRLHDVWETSKNLYLVLEYVEGGELFDLLVERGPLPENEAIKYFRQIILGTAYCHALGICHRDLKPENLLLDTNLNVKLADFGMAALESNGKLLETSCGSPHYAAPEIVSGLKYHGFASDVWSCGVILFALLTGRLPFDDENIRDLLLKVQAGSFEMPMDISFEAQDLIAKMLTVNPDSRIKTELILKHPLLNKYPIPNEDLISVKSLPHPQTAYKSLGSVKNIDKQILQNLSILWNDRSQQDIINSLLTNGPNPEKTFYALLLRYRHNQDDPINSPKNHLVNTNNNGRFPPRSNSIKNNMTPRKARASQISASLSRHRPVLFQYKNGVRNSMLNGRISTSSVNNSPYKSPYRSPRHQTNTSPRKFQYGGSPQKSGSPRRSPFRASPSNRAFANPNNTSPAVPRNIYNEIVSAQNNGSFKAMPPPLPSKDSMGHYEQVETYNARHSNDIPYGNQGQGQGQGPQGQAPGPFQESAPLGSHDLMASANVSPSKKSNLPKSNSKNRLSRRKSFRMSMHNGLKRNSITVKLLSTYAKLAGETDWEYMEKQTKRTSATFATLCDKIFNEEQYDQDDENLVDEEEKRALEYERLMEIERKKHEAEMRARKELAKQRRRQKRRSLLSSKKLSIIVKDDDTNAQSDITASGNELTQPKRQSKAQNNGLRSISEGTGKEERDDELTREDLEKIKKRSVTQPAPKPRTHPVLTRRPVSRLDPLWTAYENEELNRAKDALDAEYKDAKAERTKKDKRRVSRANRESMISVMDNSEEEDIEDDHKPNHRSSKSYKLPDVDMERSDLSEEYLTEIRKSRLLNSQMNIHGIAKGEKNIEVPKKGQKQKTLIGDVDIPNVTRKSRHFTNSNKRLSVLSMYSTKESYHDLNSIVHNESNKDKAKMSQMRTSFADRLDRAGLDNYDNEDDEEPLDEGSILDFDEHLANKRSSYYAGPRSNTVKRHSKPGRPTSDLPNLPPAKGSKHAHIADETFATKHDGDYKKHRAGDEDYYGGVLDQGEESEEPDELEEGETKVFENIKLPPTGKDGKGKERSSKTKSMQPSAESMLLPDLGTGKGNGGPRTKPYAATKAKGKDTNYPAPTIDNEAPYDKPRTTIPKPKSMGQKQRQKPKPQPLEDTTNRPQEPKKNKSIFRKLSWGSKKTFDDISNPQQLPSPVDSRDNSYEETNTNTKPAQRQNSFFRWFSSSSSSSTAQAHETTPDAEIRRFHTILPKQEMSSALFALLNSWSNFGLKNLKNDTYAYIITGAISRHNAFNLKSCKFRIKINPREFNQKSEIVCARVKGSRVTSNTLFKEIEKVLCKEGVMDN